MATASLIFAAISAIAGAVAAIAAWRATDETRRAAQAQLVASLRSEYASSAMLEAIERVKRWHAGSPVTPDGPLDHARRLVSHHFQRIVALSNAGLLEERLMPVVVTKDEADLFCGAVQRIEQEVNPNYDRSAFERLERLYFGHPDSDLHRLAR